MAGADGRRVLSDVELVVDRLDSTVGALLAGELMDDLAVRYGGPDPDEPIADDLASPAGVFLVARAGDELLGCGGVRRPGHGVHEDGVGEIKRMYVRESARRRGVARALLAGIEDHARRIGYSRLVLETGTLQPEAIALYEVTGYRHIEPYGLYKDSPLSRCFAKDL